MKNLITIAAASLCAIPAAHAQVSYTSTAPTQTTWDANRWNNTANTAPYTSAYTPNNDVSFTAGSYFFTNGMGSAIDVGNVTVASGANVTFGPPSTGTFATGGNVRTFTVGAGSKLDFFNQTFSTAAGTGFIKEGAGVLALSGSTYTGGFTLNAGTVIAYQETALGEGVGNMLTLNGGAIATNSNRNFAANKFQGGIVVGGNVQLGELSTVLVGANSTATFSFANNVSLGSATRTLTLGNNANMTFSGIISGSAGLTVSRNAGTAGNALVLTGNNSYTGATTVTNGAELRLTGAGAIASSSGISLGNATNTEFDVTGISVASFSLPGNTTFTIGTTTGSNGLFNATGKTLDYNGTTLTLNLLGVLAEGTYSFNLFDGTTSGTISAFQFAGAYTGGFGSLSNTVVGNGYFSYNAATGVLNVVAVPESRDWAVAMAGLLGIVVVARRANRVRERTPID